MIERIIDTINGDVIEVPYTPEQIEDSKKTQQAANEEIAKLEEKKAAKKAIFEKLGLSEAEAKLLFS